MDDRVPPGMRDGPDAAFIQTHRRDNRFQIARGRMDRQEVVVQPQGYLHAGHDRGRGLHESEVGYGGLYDPVDEDLLHPRPLPRGRVRGWTSAEGEHDEVMMGPGKRIRDAMSEDAVPGPFPRMVHLGPFKHHTEEYLIRTCHVKQ